MASLREAPTPRRPVMVDNSLKDTAQCRSRQPRTTSQPQHLPRERGLHLAQCCKRADGKGELAAWRGRCLGMSIASLRQLKRSLGDALSRRRANFSVDGGVSLPPSEDAEHHHSPTIARRLVAARTLSGSAPLALKERKRETNGKAALLKGCRLVPHGGDSKQQSVQWSCRRR